MGAADVVPGVSGGTVAFITGIYERLLRAIASIDLAFLQLLLQRQWSKAWKKIDGTFLLALSLGIGSSFLLLSRVVLFLMENFQEAFWAAMAGLILASTVLVWRQLKQWRWWLLVPLLAGGAFAYGITVATPAQTPDALWFLFLSGVIAISAMILPGISGSFILLLLQKYEYMMTAIKEIQVLPVLVFMVGCLVGLLTLARVLKVLFTRFHDATVMVMAGFMLGSLAKLWPWKQVLETYVDSKGHTKPLVQINVSPEAYAQLGLDPQVPQVVIAFVVALILVLALELVATKKKRIEVIKI